MRRVRSSWGRAAPRRRLLSAAAIFAAALVALVLALSLGGGSKSPKPVAPPSTRGSTAQQARAFSAWLRGHAAVGGGGKARSSQTKPGMQREAKRRELVGGQRVHP